MFQRGDNGICRDVGGSEAVEGGPSYTNEMGGFDQTKNGFASCGTCEGDLATPLWWKEDSPIVRGRP